MINTWSVRSAWFFLIHSFHFSISKIEYTLFKNNYNNHSQEVFVATIVYYVIEVLYRCV